MIGIEFNSEQNCTNARHQWIARRRAKKAAVTLRGAKLGERKVAVIEGRPDQQNKNRDPVNHRFFPFDFSWRALGHRRRDATDPYSF